MMRDRASDAHGRILKKATYAKTAADAGVLA
jgi:hypothetical protein